MGKMPEAQNFLIPPRICAKVYPEGIQPFKGNNCRPIPVPAAMARHKGIEREA